MKNCNLLFSMTITLTPFVKAVHASKPIKSGNLSEWNIGSSVLTSNHLSKSFSYSRRFQKSPVCQCPQTMVFHVLFNFLSSFFHGHPHLASSHASSSAFRQFSSYSISRDRKPFSSSTIFLVSGTQL